LRALPNIKILTLNFPYQCSGLLKNTRSIRKNLGDPARKQTYMSMCVGRALLENGRLVLRSLIHGESTLNYM
jgi:hypothetical protein